MGVPTKKQDVRQVCVLLRSVSLVFPACGQCAMGLVMKRLRDKEIYIYIPASATYMLIRRYPPNISGIKMKFSIISKFAFALVGFVGFVAAQTEGAQSEGQSPSLAHSHLHKFIYTYLHDELVGLTGSRSRCADWQGSD